jgi:CRP/FNR family cyclic AMP-dependent transcriptional regulator
MAMLSNLDLIRRVPLFAQLTSVQAESLANAVGKQRFKRGDSIVERGQTSNALYIILSGRARVMMIDSKGREVILAALRSGDHIGEISLIDGMPHSATVRAEIVTDVLVLGRDDFVRCIAENAAIAHAVMKVLAMRLRNATTKIGSLALVGVYGRVANVLLEMSLPDEEGGLTIPQKVSRQDLAKMVGASREMVSRVMKDFEEQGFIHTQTNGFVKVFERRQSAR